MLISAFFYTNRLKNVEVSEEVEYNNYWETRRFIGPVTRYKEYLII